MRRELMSIVKIRLEITYQRNSICRFSLHVHAFMTKPLHVFIKLLDERILLILNHVFNPIPHFRLPGGRLEEIN